MEIIDKKISLKGLPIDYGTAFQPDYFSYKGYMNKITVKYICILTMILL